jgi:hypothetical protein
MERRAGLGEGRKPGEESHIKARVKRDASQGQAICHRILFVFPSYSLRILFVFFSYSPPTALGPLRRMNGMPAVALFSFDRATT